MATNRSYGDVCGLAQALDTVGERWALLVVRELVLGPKRYSDLQADLPGISTNVLSHRLDELERGGVLTRRRLRPPAASSVYELTAWGQELEPIICRLGRWGVRSPAWSPDGNLSPTSLVLSLRTMFDPAAAAGVTCAVELRLGETRCYAAVADGQLTIVPASGEPVDAAIEAAPLAVARMVYGEGNITDAVKITGDRAAVERFRTVFSLPVRAST